MENLIRLQCASVVGSMLLTSAPTALAQAGTIDTNYLANADGAVRSVALQPDGKLLIAGDFRSTERVGRQVIALLNPNGSLDSEFHTVIDWGLAQSVLLQSDGKVIVAGDFQQEGTYFPLPSQRMLPSSGRRSSAPVQGSILVDSRSPPGLR